MFCTILSTYAMLSWVKALLNNISQIWTMLPWHFQNKNYLWLTDNCYEENNWYNVVLIMLGQHCIGVLSSQCCLNTSEMTLHKKITCAMLVHSAQPSFPRKIILLICLGHHCTRNYLCNVGSQSSNTFAHENNLQCFLDLSGSTLHKEITCAMLVHS